MIKKIIILSVLSVVLCVLFLSCGKKTPSENEKPVFAFIVDIPGRFWEIAYAGCLQAAEEENVTAEYHVPGQSTPAQQQQIVESLVGRGCDGIAICPMNPQSISRMLDAVSEYMPVLCQGSDASESKRLAYVGADNVAAGRTAGELLKKALPEGGKVAIFSATMDIVNQRERSDGVLEALQIDTRYEVVGVFTDQADRTRAQANVRAILAKYPDLKGIVGVAGYNAPAAVMALRDLQDSQVKVIGFDEDIDTIEAIRKGEIFASVAQQPYEFGYHSIKMLAKVHRGEKLDLPPDGIIFVPVYIIDKENVDSVEKDIALKLGKLDMKLKHF